MNKPLRIISLVPSQTELLYYLGLKEEVIAITKFCVHPEEWFRSKTRIGGTKNIDIEKILSLKPDLVIANKEENVKEQVEALQEFTHVHITDVANLQDAMKMIKDIGALVGKQNKAEILVEEIRQRFSELNKIIRIKISAAYLIWRNPYMAAGGDTFINDMMHFCGLQNIFENQLRYPVTDISELKNIGCKILFLSSEPYPFKQKHINELQPLLPNTKILLVDGELFSWYGSRLLYAPAYFKQVINIINS